MLTAKGTLILRTVFPFAGAHWREGLWPVLLRCEESPTLMLNLPVTTGARESLRRGIRATIQGARVLHSVFWPTEPGPPVAGVARRRRGGWRGCADVAKPLRGKAALGWLLQSSWPAALWLSAASGEHTKGTKREEGCGLRHAAGTIARESCSYVVFELQKSAGGICRPHRSALTGPQAGSIERSAES